MKNMKFDQLAFAIMSKYIPTKEIPSADLRSLIARSVTAFRDPEVTPVVKTGNFWTLELFHGPTFAFKDVALQFLGNLFEALLEDRPGMRITVLGATSGDTGSSAIHGLRGKKNVECFIMYPEGRTSRTQELQMITVSAAARVFGAQFAAIRSEAASARNSSAAQFSDAPPRSPLR